MADNNKYTIEHRVHIVCSPYKTGSSSLEQALLELGVASKPMPHSQKLLKKYKDKLFYWRQQANQSASFEEFAQLQTDNLRQDLASFTKQLRKFDVFADAPFGHTHTHPFVRKIIAPKAILIWIHRDFETWSASVKRWEIGRPAVYAAKIELWQSDPDLRLEQLRKLWRNSYRRYLQTKTTFPDDCLELQLETLNTYEPLAQFYKVKCPNKPFPLKNTNPSDVISN